MRTQETRIQTGAVRKRILPTFIVLMIVVVIYFIGFYTPPYTPPPFESNVSLGLPKPPENMGYGRVEAEGGFYFSVVGTLYQQEDGSLLVYLTNHDDSRIWLRCDVVDENGKVLYKSGVLKQGEYVERLYPEKKLKNEATKIEMRVYGFEPETYYSMGSVFLNNILQPW